MENSQKFANVLSLTGNLVDDPQERTFASGTKQVTFKIAQNQGYKDKDGNWVETDALFMEFRCINKTANAIEEMGLKKGDKIYIKNSKLEPNNWTKNDSTRVYGFRGMLFNADDVEILLTAEDRRAMKQAQNEAAPDVEPAAEPNFSDDLPF